MYHTSLSQENSSCFISPSINHTVSLLLIFFTVLKNESEPSSEAGMSTVKSVGHRELGPSKNLMGRVGLKHTVELSQNL